ncbi:MAG: C4-dicarboxylate ABC transporter substrate-binding protein, partial [Syntrophales bacterium]|nr:C4-dicarboxylate ABC transporter substrate-binding protein [Syntrophales bacterium]
MKRHKAHITVIFILCIAALPLLFNGKVEAKTQTLNYSIFFPPTHGQALAAAAWAEEIEKRTEGKVRI